MAESAEPCLRSPAQLEWLARLHAENDNIRAALQWSLNGDEDGLEAGLCLAGGVYRYWYFRGASIEGRDWLKQLLACPLGRSSAPAPASARLKALCAAGWLADEDASERAYYTEAIELSRAGGDRWHEAFALRGLVAAESNWLTPEPTERALRDSLAIFESLHDDWGVGLVYYNLGWRTGLSSQADRALENWRAALASFRRSGDRWGIAVTLNALGYVARTHGDYPRAINLARESLALFQELGDKAGIATSLSRLGNIAWYRVILPRRCRCLRKAWRTGENG